MELWRALLGAAVGAGPSGERWPRRLCATRQPCAGCPAIHLTYEEQLARKRASVAGCIARYPALAELSAPEVAAAEPYVAYRARAKLVVETGRVGLFSAPETTASSTSRPAAS